MGNFRSLAKISSTGARPRNTSPQFKNSITINSDQSEESYCIVLKPEAKDAKEYFSNPVKIFRVTIRKLSYY